MAHKSIVEQFRQIRLFSKLKRQDLSAIARRVERRQFQVDDVVCHQGEIGHSLYVVESGELAVFHVNPQGIERKVDTLGPGDYFGETSLLLGEQRDATVKAIQDTVLLSLNGDDFDQLIDEHPSILDDLDMREDVEQKYHAQPFKGQAPDEIIVLRLHKHHAILIRNLIFPSFVLLVVLTGSGYWYVQSKGAVLPLIVGTLLALIPTLFIVYLILDHRNDNYIVTNKRVIHEESVPFVREARVEATLDVIEDIQQLQEGPLAHWLKYGNLVIETAGERGHVVFRDIPNPSRTREVIFEQRDRVKAWAKAKERAAIRGDLREHFGVYFPEPEIEEPALSPSQERSRRRRLIAWLTAPLRVFTFFLPKLRDEQGDTITWRKHWVALIGPIALPTLLIFAATIIALVLLGIDLGTLSTVPVLIGYGITIAILFPWWLWRFDDWQNDIYQVTSTRIIDVERLPFYLREERREANLASIQNISLEIPGVSGKLLNYGSVTIETAGAGAFTFPYVKDPHSVQAEIFRRKEALQKRLRQEEFQRHRNELLDWFAVYDQFRRSSSEPLQQPPMEPPSLQQET